jgi:hypothetical protein
MTSQGEQTAWDPWSYRQSLGVSGSKVDLVGFKVEAIDGGIGKIDEATYDVASSYIVVDTGPWIFGSKLLLPAGTIVRIDRTDRKVQVEHTKEEIKNAPSFDEDAYTDQDYRDRLGDYYRGFPY